MCSALTASIQGYKTSGLDSYRGLKQYPWAESVVGCLAPGPAEFVAFLIGVSR